MDRRVCRLRVGNSKFVVAQVFIKLSWAKQEHGCFGLQQAQHTILNGRIWVMSGGFQTIWLAKKHMSIHKSLYKFPLFTNVAQVALCTHTAQSSPVAVTCWAGR